VSDEPNSERRDDAGLDQATIRARALMGLVVAMALGIGTWIFLTRAADAGLARLDRIDVVRAGCEPLWAQARTLDDTLRVDNTALPDTIDPRSSTALKRCADLRAVTTKQLPNAREMSGQPMPRGLR
jgi:hypothetical protein